MRSFPASSRQAGSVRNLRRLARAPGRSAIALACALALFAALPVSVGCGASGRSNQRITLAGAQIPVELVENWLKASRAVGFASERRQPVYLSQNGFQAMARGEADIACTDRVLTPRERTELFAGRSVEGRRVGFYGFALYVNPSNPLDSLYSGHLKLVCQKKILDWKDLSNQPVARLEGPIRILGPRKSTRAGEMLARQARIWFAEPTWEVMDSDAEIVAAVAQDPLALGVASVGLDRGVRYLGLRLERNGPPALPSLEEIESERYGLAKVIYVYALSPIRPDVQRAIDYLFSDEGRRAIEATEVWPVSASTSRVVSP